MSFFSDLLAKQPLLIWTAIAHLVLAIFFFIGLFVDQRLILGINPWIKPLKFAVSIAIYLVTIALFINYLPEYGRSLKWVSLVIAVTLIIEILAISLQALRGTTSHFNISTPLDGAIFSIMGFAIAINSLMAAIVLFKYFTQPPDLTPSYLWGIRLGIVVFILGSLQGFQMASRLAHTVGAPDGGPGLPILNWSTQFGDLRIAHFIGLHGLQVIPLVGYLASSGNNPEKCTTFSMVWTFGIAVGMIAVMVWALMQALAAKPMIKL